MSLIYLAPFPTLCSMIEMTRTAAELALLIGRFRSSISTNLLARDDFIDWDVVDARMSGATKGITKLQDFVDRGNFSEAALQKELEENPTVYGIILDLLAFSSTGTQVEKWGLPQPNGVGLVDRGWVAAQLLYVGLDKVLAGGPDVASLLRTAEIYKDSFRRRFRSGKKLDDRVAYLVKAAVTGANSELAVRVAINNNSLADASLRRSLTYVIAVGNRPIAGIATSFQNQSGGRQQRDLSATYPSLQQRLAEKGMALILIADGQGLSEASDRTLTALFEGVRFPITLNGAADGRLQSAIVQASTADVPETLDQAALSRLIEDKLRRSLSVNASDLPVTDTQGRLALSHYASSRRRANLVLSPDGISLSWTNAELVKAARNLRVIFDESGAISLFARLLGQVDPEVQKLDGFSAADIPAPSTQPFADKLLLTAKSATLTVDDAREIGRRSMEQAPGSMVAIYLTASGPSDQDLPGHRKSQIFLPTNIIIVSARLLEMMAQDMAPLERLMDAVLAQSDLTKVSPFILSNPTPSRMFYGRDVEAATVLSTIPTNSVAILGSRRIGKTSLIRRLESELSSAHFSPFFGDCQTVKTWKDFAELAQKQWGVSLADDFRPAHLGDLVDQLKSQGDGQVVIILDEIDQLIEWDQCHDEGSVPEAFFRTCRSISQEGSAQFVFAGERRIATRLWDPHSPHWNFCRDLQLAQLNRSDAVALLVQPLRAMNIALEEIATFEELAWSRTSGHPQIVQFLGDRLVRLLDERENRTDMSLSPSDIDHVTNTLEYAQHYVDTYWGQATPFEKVVSELVALVPVSVDELGQRLEKRGQDGGIGNILAAIRMLQLYGIIVEAEGGISLRATWLPNALAQFGP